MRSMFAVVNAIQGLRASFIENYFRIVAPTSSICNTGIVNTTNPTCLPITWAIVSGPATINSGQGTYSVTLQRKRNGSGSGINSWAHFYIKAAIRVMN